MPSFKHTDGVVCHYDLKMQVNLHKGDIIFYRKGNGKVAHAKVYITHCYDDLGSSAVIATDNHDSEDWKYKFIRNERILFYIPLILEHFLYTPEFIENLAELLEKAYEGVED